MLQTKSLPRPRVIRRAGNVIHLTPNRSMSDEELLAEINDLGANELRKLIDRCRALWSDGSEAAENFLEALEQRADALEQRAAPPPSTPAQRSQYRQDIWDSFPELQRSARVLAIHPYHETQE